MNPKPAVYIFLAALLLPLALACRSGGGAPAGSPTDGAKVSFNGEECVYIGPRSLRTGPLLISFENRSDEAATLEAWRLNEGRSFDDFVAYFSDAANTEAPSWVSPFPGPTEERDGITAFRPRLVAGSWALTCTASSDGQRFFAGPLTVKD